MAKKACPRCAEKVRREAQVCRFCGHEFEANQEVYRDRPRRWILAVVGVATLILSGGLGFVMYKDIQSSRQSATAEQTVQAPGANDETAPEYDVLATGETFEWSASDQPDTVHRQVGPYVVTISKKSEDNFVAPVVELTVGNQSVQMVGQPVSSTYTHHVTAVQNFRGAPPIVMLESFSGGAHCCVSVKLAGLSKGKLKVVELGSWDGDRIQAPKDISGDGIADFVVRDDSFLYAFASYASSYSPPMVLNVANGQVVDVSRRATFNKLFTELSNEAGQVCRFGDSSDQRNGACPAYVASAARAGKLQQAWSHMLAAYDPKTDWDFPTACRVKKDPCPPGLEIQFKSYPESLLHFLKERNYIPKSWLPPEAYDFEAPAESNDADWTA